MKQQSRDHVWAERSWPALRSPGRRFWPSNKLLVLLICFAVPFLARTYALQDPAFLNVDEAQWTVSARRVLDDPIIWRSTDLTTSGPLNAVVLAWPYLIGHIPSITSSRLTALLLQSISLLGVASLLRRQDLIGPGLAAILLSVATLTLSTDPNFIHSSSEAVPITLMVLFCVLLAGLEHCCDRPWRWALCGFVATCLPFAKLQSVPVCVLFHAVCSGRLLLGLYRGLPSWRSVAAYVAGSLLPVLFLIVPLYGVGEQQAFWTGYLGLAAGYIGARTLYPFRMIGPQIVLDAALTWWAVRPLAQARSEPIMRWDLLFLALLLWPALFLVIWLPGRPFIHYDLYALIGMPLAVTLAQRALPPLRPPIGLARLLPAGLAGFVACLGAALLALPNTRTAFAHAALSSHFAEPSAASRPLLAWTGVTPQDQLFMWGWEPEITAYAELKSGDRAAQGEYLIRPNPVRDYLRTRLLHD